MKILLVHNDYGKYSGEEAVVDKMALMLEASGHNVAQLRMSSAKVIGSTIGKSTDSWQEYIVRQAFSQ